MVLIGGGPRFGCRKIEPAKRESLRLFVMTTPSFDSLLSAIRRNDCAELQQLVDAGLDPNAEYAEGRTALILAAEYQKPQIVRLLLQAGADVAHRDHDGYDAVLTANHFGEYRMGAYTKESQEIVAMLKKHMADFLDRPGSESSK